MRFALDSEPEATLALRLTPNGANSADVSLTLEVSSIPSIFLNGLVGGMLNEDMARLKRNLEG